MAAGLFFFITNPKWVDIANKLCNLAPSIRKGVKTPAFKKISGKRGGGIGPLSANVGENVGILRYFNGFFFT